MADVSPFRGIRYDDVIALDDVVSPPYDVLSADRWTRLRDRSPYNVVRVDVPAAPGQAADDAAYGGAAALFRQWRAEGVLRRDQAPAVYLVDQQFVGPDGRQRTRRGFIARLRLTDYGEGVVRPHERTHAGPRLDRLRLLRATHADLSQVLVLFADDDGAVGAALADGAAATPASSREVRDDDGTLHRVTPLGGGAAESIATALRGRPVYIADGHHRYETALAYRDERRADGDHSADTLMAHFCSLSDPGLAVFPTHRLVKGVSVPSADRLLESLRPAFEVARGPVRGAGAGCDLLERVPRRADPGRLVGLFLAREDVCVVVRTREPEATRRLLAAGLSRQTAALPVAALHELVLRDALGMDPADEERQLEYVTSVPEALARLASGGYDLAAFLGATEVEQVRAVADGGEVMPQKSTYFYPKPLTGLVFDALGD